MRAYERILVDYAREDTVRPRRKGGHERNPEHILGEGFSQHTFSNQQYLDYVGLEGRTLSSSMMPLAGQPNFEPMLAALRQLFETYQVHGRVTVKYITQLYTSQI